MTRSPLQSGTRRATAQLLWEACRRNPDTAEVARAVDRGADVPWAVRTAGEQRVGPLLWRALDQSTRLEVLGDERRFLQSLAEVHKMEALLLLPRAVQIALSPLTDVGLEPVVLKGPAVAARYPEPGLRTMDDIDVLLPARQHPAALGALAEAGWQVIRPARRDRYDTVLAHGEVPSFVLELHHALDASYERSTSVDADGLWASRVPIDCLGTPAFGLPLTEELVALAVHAGKPYHCFCRLIWIADLVMVVGHSLDGGADLDWTGVRDLSMRFRCPTVVSAALWLAANAGLEFPASAFPLPEGGWRGTALSRLLDLEWPLGGEDLPTYHLRYALTDGWWRRFRVLVGSSHGMPFTDRIRWTSAAPVDAYKRWSELHRRRYQPTGAREADVDLVKKQRRLRPRTLGPKS